MGIPQRLGTIPLAIFTDASNNVGIGVTPTTRLTIGRVDSSSEGAQIDLCRASDNFNAWGIDVFGNTTTPSLRFIDNAASAARMVISGTGNVGIGTSTPNYSATNRTVLDINGTNSSLLAFSIGGTQQGYIFNNSTDQTYWTEGSRNMQFGIAGAGFMGFGTNNTERIRITSGGNVGINLTNPTGRFHIYSDNSPSISGTSPTGAFVIQSTATTALTMGVEPTNPFYGWIQMRHGAVSGLAYSLVLQPLGGNVYIGTTSAGLNSAKLFVFANAGGTTAEFGINAISGTAIRFSNAQDLGGSITVSSGGGTSYNTSSDYRLKEDFKEINGLEKVLAIKTYNYKWKICDDRIDGVIAHELAEILPYAVNGVKDGEEMQGVDYSKLVPVLIKAIQELSAKVSALENKS